ELLVEGGLGGAGPVLAGRPEPRRVGCQRLVAEYEPALAVEPELELRVRDDDPALACMLCGEPVERDRDACDLVEELFADESRGGGPVDVLVMAGGRLGGRREQRLGELGRLREPGRKHVSADCAGRRVVLPAGA